MKWMKAARLSGVAVALSGAALEEVPYNMVIDQGVTCGCWREISVRCAVDCIRQYQRLLTRPRVGSDPGA